jgi:phosphate starvation-inducible PhoH-like protein
MSRRRRATPRYETPESSGFKPRNVTARTPKQKDYILSLTHNDITFCFGPAGTGKTHIAAGMAVQMLRHKAVDKIIVCRPIISVGKDIGFLPGTVEDKVGPYLVPLFDEFSHYLERKKLKELTAEHIIEMVPLSMMRGRTFNDSFIILDEAQNASYSEIRMLLTRIGEGSTLVLSGDLRQSDLPFSEQGSLEEIGRKLQMLHGVGLVFLTEEDVIRHSLIAQIERIL